jgi:hypothetical protein
MYNWNKLFINSNLIILFTGKKHCRLIVVTSACLYVEFYEKSI